MEKRKPSFTLILAQTISEQIVLLLFSLISGGFGVSKSYGESIEMFESVPLPVWYGIFIVGIVFIFSKALLTYRKELESFNSQGKPQKDIATTLNSSITSSSQSGGFTGSNTGQLFQGEFYFPERESVPSEFYVPKSKELKSKINIEILNLQRELKTFLCLSGENGRKQFEVVLEIAVNIWKNLLNPAKAIFSDTQIPVLIDEIYTQITRFKMNWETLKYEYDEKNNWLRVAKSNHPEIIVINKKIADLEKELDQLVNSIEAKINLLIDLTKN